MSKNQKTKHRNQARPESTEAVTPEPVVTAEAVVQEPVAEPVKVKCLKCGHMETYRFGVIKNGKQPRCCKKCNRSFLAKPA